MNKKQGFTLLELIFSMGLLILILSAIVVIYVSLLRVYTSEFARSDAKNSVERGIYRIVVELRSATQITTYDSQSIIFAPVSGEAISYSWSGILGENLLRTQGGSSLDLVQNVQGFLISYIPTMEVFNISLSARSGSDGFSASSAVRLRNI